MSRGTAQYHVLSVAAGEAVRVAANLGADMEVELAPSLEVATARLGRTPKPDLIVVGSSLNPGRAGDDLLSIQPGTQILFMIRPEGLARFRAGLPFMPRLGHALTAPDDAPPADLHRLIREALSAGRDRAEFGTVISRINAQLSRASVKRDLTGNQRRLSERYFSTLLSTVPDAFFALDLDGRLIAFNEPAAALFSIGDRIGEAALSDFIAESALPDLDGLFGRAAAGEIIRLAELPLRSSPPGRTRWIELSLARVPAEAPEAESISGIAREVSERKQLENDLRHLNETLEAQVAERTVALQQSEISMRTVFETSHQNQGLLSPDGNVLYVNKTSLDSIKGRLEDVVGRPFWDTPWFTGTSGMPELVRQAVERVAKGETATVSMPLEMPTGHRVYDFSMRPVFSDSGKVVALVPEAVEITARVQAEEALRQAQKMEAVGQLTGGIAHDFNNLLTIVSGNIDMVMRRLGEDADPRVRRGIESALKGVERASILTQRLLAFSRRQPLDPRPLNVGRLIASMSQMLARTLGETIVIETVVSAGPWRVEVDAHQLENTILNLAVNARDAMPNGGKLTIEASNSQIDRSYASAHPEVAEGSYVVMAVSDTGVGMDAETRAKAFDPFYTTKEVGKGTGLGLSMVYGFVKQSGGHVKIYSEPGQGTTMKVYLPKMVGERPEDVSHATETVEFGRGHETVLVVEDDDDVRAFTVDSLRELGYRVVEAPNGQAALRLMDRPEHVIDLLFTDVVMPEMSGRELADRIQERRPGISILYTSGYTRNAMTNAGRLDPSVDLLPKPFTFANLAEKVRQVLDRNEMEGAADA